MSHRLKPGDVVEVRSPAEILSTLDDEASIDGMPFMVEMLQYAGKRFTVTHRVEKICDTVSSGPANSRRMLDAVLLDDLRCDGSAHGGCQAGCRIYWKESWLRRVDDESRRSADDGGGRARLEELATAGSRPARADNGASGEVYRCQATEALRASEPLSGFDLRQYVRELTSGNVGPLRFLRVAIRAVTMMIRRRLHLLPDLPVKKTGAPIPTSGDLNLQPGDVVEVRSLEEIGPTIDDNGRTRGLSFDWEMAPYCGGRYQVKDRVERIIDERNGQMIEISSDCLILDGVVCSGDHSTCRWFCPRAIYPYWREAWLRRADDPGPASTNGSAAARSRT